MTLKIVSVALLLRSVLGLALLEYKQLRSSVQKIKYRLINNLYAMRRKSFSESYLILSIT